MWFVNSKFPFFATNSDYADDPDEPSEIAATLRCDAEGNQILFAGFVTIRIIERLEVDLISTHIHLELNVSNGISVFVFSQHRQLRRSDRAVATSRSSNSSWTKCPSSTYICCS